MRPPACVLTASKEYLDSCNSFELWFDECTEPAPPYSYETAKALFSSWKTWLENNGEKLQTSQRTFGEKLGDRLPKGREDGKGPTIYYKIRLKRHDYTNDPRYG